VAVSTFDIYNASAGSGKTFTLVKDYLKIVLSSKKFLPHRHVLAITFTNKAVDEMKTRIIEALMAFASPTILDHPDALFTQVVEELQNTPEEIHVKSKHLLSKILHNYAAFDISTIDKFTQKIIRTFAFDLKLPMNFEVELDTDHLLQKAVLRLLSKAGKNKALTKVLVDFAVEKADDDKSWNIALDLTKTAKLLTKETEAPFLQGLAKHSLSDFEALKESLAKEIYEAETQIVSASNQVLELIISNGIEFSDFSRGSLPKHFKALASKKFDLSFSAQWQQSIDTAPLYTQKTTSHVASIIDGLRPELIEAFLATKTIFYRLKYLKNIRKNTTPLSVINLINKELKLIKEEDNLLLISEFNTIISQEIKDQPAPFIYERIGEKFNHFFIDEFQDTSELQWENLVPLITDTLAAENGSAMLVGDAKQAIYRWRGGRAEQFISLYNNDTDLPFDAELSYLPTNYRSCREIVGFNNRFFKHLSKVAFSNQTYKELYQASAQLEFTQKAGYVNISFLEFEKGDDKPLIYATKVLQIINTYLDSDQDTKLKDICVLVRKRKEGIAVANLLSQHDIDIVSSETLLVSQSPEVKQIVSLLEYIHEPLNVEVKLEVINYIAINNDVGDPHLFRLNGISLGLEAFFAALKDIGIHFSPQVALQLSLYESVEYIISSFQLSKKSNAYIQFFLDFVLEFTQRPTSSVRQFMDHYNLKKESLSIVTPKGINAVQIMTVHKSKGLEFPVVIFPFAELDIYRELEPKEWMPLEASFAPFSHFLLNYNKDFENYGTVGASIYNDHQSKLELDNINLLYVALTRAVEQLYVVGNASVSKKGDENLKTYSGLLINYLRTIGHWEASKLEYEFGVFEKIDSLEPPKYPTEIQTDFISTPKAQLNVSMATNAGYLWDTSQKEAIEKGNLIHLLLSKVYTKSDIEITFNHFINTGVISKEQGKALRQTVEDIVSHPKLSIYYSSEVTVFNEREIMTESGKIIIPDRLVVFKDQTAVIIDYKTGDFYNKHKLQLIDYAEIIEQMGYKVSKKLLVYTEISLQIHDF
jgi:ATP-dependent exoDNAse (exonuclease V) beta subunit